MTPRDFPDPENDEPMSWSPNRKSKDKTIPLSNCPMCNARAAMKVDESGKVFAATCNPEDMKLCYKLREYGLVCAGNSKTSWNAAARQWAKRQANYAEHERLRQEKKGKYQQ